MGNMKTIVGFLLFGVVLAWFSRVSQPCNAVEPTGVDRSAGRIERIQTERAEKDRFFREDPRSPLRSKDQKNFKGLAYYPIDARHVFSGPLERDRKKPPYVKLQTNRGNYRTYVKEGTFRFTFQGKEFTLTIYRFMGRSSLFLPFRDRTNGHETYKHGRYVDVEVLGDNTIVVDFNTAHNPFCAYNPKYTCAYAPEENTLDVAIRSGEKDFSLLP